MTSLVHTEVRGRVLVAALARPPVNALNDTMLATLDADYVTGQVLSVNGGLTMAG